MILKNVIAKNQIVLDYIVNALKVKECVHPNVVVQIVIII